MTLHTPARLRASVFFFFFANGLCSASWASRIPDIKLALSLSDAMLGTLLLAAPIGQLIFVPVAGQFVTAIGSRLTLLIAVPVNLLLLVLIGSATTIWPLAALLFLLGVFGNLAFIAMNTQAVGVELMHGRAIMSSFHGGWSIGGFSGAALGMLARGFGISPAPHFLIVGVLVIFGAWINAAALIARETPRNEEKPPLFSKLNPSLLYLGVIGFCGLAAEGAMFDWSGVYFQQVVRPSEHLVLLGYAAFMSCMAIGRFSGDHLTQRYGYYRTLQASGLLIFIGLGISALLPNIVCATIGFMITGFGVSTVVPTLFSIAGRSGITNPSMAIATVSGLAFFGFLAAPPLIGYIAEATSMRASFFVIALLGLSVCLLASGAKLVRDADK